MIMISSSDSDSDSSIDSLEKNRLLEAAVSPRFPNEPTESHQKVSIHTEEKLNRNKFGMQHLCKRSLRPSEKNEFSEHDDLKTTPEFKEFIAKKLSQILDKNIEDRDEMKSSTSSLEEDTGIRLFVKSMRLVKSDGDDVPLDTGQKQRKRKYSSSSSSSEENQRLAEAAVSHDFIMKESRLSIPGSDLDQEKSSFEKDTHWKTKQNIETTVSNHISVAEENCDNVEKRPKKKKKKHKHKSEIKVS